MVWAVTRVQLTSAAALGSAGLLAAAFIFQLFDYAPCKLCIWQRYPHAVAMAAGLLALMLRQGAVIVIGALAALTTAGLGVYHAGVEQGWWPGPATCSGGEVGNLSADALFDQIMAAPLIRCDEIPWDLFGLSMAGWNALLSFALAGLWLAALRRA